MANIVTKMLLDDKEYSAKINKAKQNTSDFKKEVDAMGKKMSGDIVKGFTAVGAAIGVAGGAVETFKKLMTAGQEAGDKWAATMKAATTSVDEFFYAIRNADFTVMFNGLDSMIAKATNAAASLDALGNATMSFSYFDAINKSNFAKAINQVKDGDVAQLTTAEDILKNQELLVTNYTQKATKAINDLMVQRNLLNANQIQDGDLSRTLWLDAYGTQADKDSLAQQYKQYQRVVENLQSRRMQTSSTGMMNGQVVTVSTGDLTDKEYQNQLTMTNAFYKNAILYNTLLQRQQDSELDQIIQINNQAENAAKAYQEMNNQIREARNVAKNLKTDTGAIAETISVKLGTPGAASGIRGGSVSGPNITKIDFGGIEQGGEQIQQISNTAPTAIDGINGIASAMSSLSSVAGEGAAAWLTWGSNLLTSIAAAIPALTALSGTQKTVAGTNTTAAASGAAASVASVPFVGPALAVAAIASIVAALASIPKFATGGIVPGSSFTGDNVLARVNSGEMILNRDQQALLSQRLNGNGSQVEFFIEGDRLRGIMTNQITIDSRRL